MNRSLPFWGACAFLSLAAISACGVDDRGMVFEYNSLSAAGSNAVAGNQAAGDSNGPPNGGASGSGGGDTSFAGDGANANGGNTADAGATSTAGASGGGAASGGANGLGGATSSGGGAGSATAGRASAGNAGQGGSAVAFPCGDLNLDSVDDCTQTLVQNSRFDATVTGWDSEPSTTQAWDASNASGANGSGSLKVSNTAAMAPAVGSLSAGSHQCVAVTPVTNYDFAARVMLSASETSGQAGVNVWLFDDGDCQGNLVSGGTPILGGVAGSWSVLTGKLWIPGGVHSMYVRLVAIKPFMQPALSVLIDDVLVAKH